MTDHRTKDKASAVPSEEPPQTSDPDTGSETPTLSSQQACGRCQMLLGLHSAAASLCYTCALVCGSAAGWGDNTVTRLGQLGVLFLGSTGAGFHTGSGENSLRALGHPACSHRSGATDARYCLTAERQESEGEQEKGQQDQGA
jgi:hypothetical protein